MSFLLAVCKWERQQEEQMKQDDPMGSVTGHFPLSILLADSDIESRVGAEPRRWGRTPGQVEEPVGEA